MAGLIVFVCFSLCFSFLLSHLASCALLLSALLIPSLPFAHHHSETPLQTASIMSPPSTQLSPPLTTPIPRAELAKHDGSNPTLPIYVAIKGDVFDVSAKKEMYGVGAGYNVFAGKDGSVGLGKSSLKPEDARPDYESLLEPAERKVLDQWYGFFEKVSRE